jgi:hypothetical protein
MSERNLEALSDRERACLAQLDEAKKLGVNFSRNCWEKDLSIHQWRWVKRALVRKGVISVRRRAERFKAASSTQVILRHRGCRR